MEIYFIPLAEQHRKDVIDILNYYIRQTTAAFRDTEVDYAHFDDFLHDPSILRAYCITQNAKTVGFCLLEAFKPIKPFACTAEVTYFLKADYVGLGIGREMLNTLESEARSLGIT